MKLVLSSKHSCSQISLSMDLCVCLSVYLSLSLSFTGTVGGAKGAAAPPSTNRSCGCKTTRRRFIKLCSMPTVCHFCCQPPHLVLFNSVGKFEPHTGERENVRRREAKTPVRLEVRDRERERRRARRPPIISRSAFNQLNSHAHNLPL
jgi:hypothetical protein